MSEFKQHRRKGNSEMRPYINGEVLVNVSISHEDMKEGSPKEGDMIARNPNNHNDQWLVSKKYYDENLEPVDKDLTFMDRLNIEQSDLEDRSKKLDSFLMSDNFSKIDSTQQVLLMAQSRAMFSYLGILESRIALLTK